MAAMASSGSRERMRGGEYGLRPVGPSFSGRDWGSTIRDLLGQLERDGRIPEQDVNTRRVARVRVQSLNDEVPQTQLRLRCRQADERSLQLARVLVIGEAGSGPDGKRAALSLAREHR